MSVRPATRSYKSDRNKSFKALEAEVSQLLRELRRAIYIPDMADEGFRDWLKKITGHYADIYKLAAVAAFAGTAAMVSRHSAAWGMSYVTLADKAGGIVHPFVVDGTKLAETMLSSRLPSGMPLSARIWDLQNYARDINAIIANGINNSIPGPVLARQLDGFLLPGRHLEGYTPYGRTLNYDSLRLARTELQHAYFEAEKENAKNTPWIEGLQWELSSGHDTLCDCDDYDGMVFAPEDVPAPPHPNCQCSLTPVLMDNDAFMSAVERYLNGEGDDIGLEGWLT